MPIPTLDQFFSLREYSYQYLCDGFKITVVTDVNCHLFLRYTLVKPQTHIVPRAIRGISLPGELYFCFVTFEDNEQEEAGDTLTHTFYKRNWPICETRWFYFWGTHAALPMRSTTALFKLHFDIIHQTFLSTPANRTIGYHNGDWATVRNFPLGIVYPDHGAPTYKLAASGWHTASKFIFRALLFLDTRTLDPTSNYADASLNLFIFEARAGSTVGKPHLFITQGVQTEPVVPPNYGYQLPITDIGGQVDLRDLVDGQYNSIPLNSVGIGFINPGGITKLCLRQEIDFYDTEPPRGSNIAVFYSQQKGPDYEPSLTICLPPP